MVGAVSTFIRNAAKLGVAVAVFGPGAALAAVVPSSAQFVPVDLVTFSKAEPTRGTWHRRLTGIVICEDMSEAMFTPLTETHTIKPGQQIDGWTLTAIHFDSVTLEMEGQTMTLKPEKLPHSKTMPTLEQQTRSAAEDLVRQQQEQAVGEATLAAATAKMTDPRSGVASAPPAAFLPAAAPTLAPGARLPPPQR
jgi:hypothetical protein